MLKKTELNWYFLVVGIFLLFLGFNNNRTNPITDSTKITVELKQDITSVKGRRGSIDYKLWTKEYENQFNILKGSINRGNQESIAKLKKGQIIEMHISINDFHNLSNKNQSINVLAISLKGYYLLKEKDFYQNRKLYSLRLNIFLIFTSIMLIINGFKPIKTKTNYLIVGIFGGVIILMRIFEIGIY